MFTVGDIDRLVANADAFALFAKLKVNHNSRSAPFALAALSMHRDNVMPGWSRNRYMATTKWLVESGDLVRIHRGGKRPHDPSLYVLPQRSHFGTQYNKDTLPPSPGVVGGYSLDRMRQTVIPIGTVVIAAGSLSQRETRRRCLLGNNEAGHG